LDVVVSRRAARLIVLDSRQRVLLVQYENHAGAFWATPGGGLEEGEDFDTAALREAGEELGIFGAQLLPLWEATVEYEANGKRVEQLERFFRIDASVALSALDAGAAERAREGIRAVRWWSRAELSHALEPIYPLDLGTRLASIPGCNLGGAWPRP